MSERGVRWDASKASNETVMIKVKKAPAPPRAVRRHAHRAVVAARIEGRADALQTAHVLGVTVEGPNKITRRNVLGGEARGAGERRANQKKSECCVGGARARACLQEKVVRGTSTEIDHVPST